MRVENTGLQVRRDCSPSSGQECPGLGQHCPHPDCVSASLSWADSSRPANTQAGCSFTTDGSTFSGQPQCLSRTFALLDHTTADGVVHLNTTLATFLPCQPWSESEPCDNFQHILAEKRKATDGNTFSLEDKPCNGEKGVELELVDISDELNKTGWKLFHISVPGYPVELRETGQCFRTKKNLCGPGSLSFYSEDKERNLVLTNCDGALAMREEYDHCG